MFLQKKFCFSTLYTTLASRAQNTSIMIHDFHNLPQWKRIIPLIELQVLNFASSKFVIHARWKVFGFQKFPTAYRFDVTFSKVERVLYSPPGKRIVEMQK